MQHDDIALLEEIAYRAWPAAHVEEHLGMRLRATGGDSRRANSAALHAARPELAAREAIDRAEAFYAARGLASQVQVGPIAPVGIDQELAARGYALTSPAIAKTAAIDDVLRRIDTAPRALEVAVDASPSEAWTFVEVTRGRYANVAAEFLGALARLGARAGYAVARLDGAPAAACLVVHDGDFAAIAAMRTLPELRRKGAARALLRAAAEWGGARGARGAFLQVDAPNAAAIALYEAAGFATRYAYHFRTREWPLR